MLNQASQTCPHCAGNLISQEIPKEARQFYFPPGAEDDGRFLFYSRVIGIYSMDKDRTVAYKCPDCGKSDRI